MQVQTTHPNKAFWEAATLVGILLLILLVSICSLKGWLWGSGGSSDTGGADPSDPANPRGPGGGGDPPVTPSNPTDPPTPRDPSGGGDGGPGGGGRNDGGPDSREGGGGGGGRGVRSNSARLTLPNGRINFDFPEGGGRTFTVDVDDASRQTPGTRSRSTRPTGHGNDFPLEVPFQVPQLSAAPSQSMVNVGGRGAPRNPTGPTMTPATPTGLREGQRPGGPRGSPWPPASPVVVSCFL